MTVYDLPIITFKGVEGKAINSTKNLPKADGEEQKEVPRRYHGLLFAGYVSEVAGATS